jgi:hypothetical protein
MYMGGVFGGDLGGGGVIWGMPAGRFPGNLSQFKNPFQKNHALAQSLLSRFSVGM